nr:hypothetical protein CFP56_10699 [Quercus suber]
MGGLFSSPDQSSSQSPPTYSSYSSNPFPPTYSSRPSASSSNLSRSSPKPPSLSPSPSPSSLKTPVHSSTSYASFPKTTEPPSASSSSSTSYKPPQSSPSGFPYSSKPPPSSSGSSPSYTKQPPAFKPILHTAPNEVTNEEGKTTYAWEKGEPIYAIPEDIKGLVKRDIAPQVLKQPLSPSTYKAYFAALSNPFPPTYSSRPSASSSNLSRSSPKPPSLSPSPSPSSLKTPVHSSTSYASFPKTTEPPSASSSSSTSYKPPQSSPSGFPYSSKPPPSSSGSSPSYTKQPPAFKPILHTAPNEVTNEEGKTTYAWEKGEPIYAIPEDIKGLVKRDIAPQVLKQPLSPSTYKAYFAALLYAEDYYLEVS